MPEVTCLFLILYLGVRDGGHAVRTPVDDAFALIDQSLVVKVYKYFLNRFGAAVIKGEAFSVPITGRAELFELLDNSAAVFAFPFPGAL